MYTANIQLATVEHVKKFVSIVSNFDFLVDIKQGKYCVNAKSIMGIFSLDLTKELSISVDIEGETLQKFTEAIQEFII